MRVHAIREVDQHCRLVVDLRPYRRVDEFQRRQIEMHMLSLIERIYAIVVFDSR